LLSLLLISVSTRQRISIDRKYSYQYPCLHLCLLQLLSQLHIKALLALSKCTRFSTLITVIVDLCDDIHEQHQLTASKEFRCNRNMHTGNTKYECLVVCLVFWLIDYRFLHINPSSAFCDSNCLHLLITSVNIRLPQFCC